ncbi:LPS export ABC transporter permease LptG [Cellvibrio japonicus]|uniref:Putative permease, YjgP/YjgQ family n=1 Tax=Cellvibrio japonicus (strain Ueda107) TaxID=498211 RepID=B3PDJ2_CELJU|nr:LPS export ABC transporter permease LptG [Cellvibrio japonicus]ACE82730.1 putative permease, YjgP/YjgQ family [Cellvibrio japonicus Ueda107]QEI12009.1 LPS export ABC transporter permease LptG [Cellvibrio japonicus]QEI15584.1 LPS export ABC transporter permease LptG [Cellvibrio japonicus]QEI19162.1 LPS export ABC transporter permease LptG [Cellvibrio japonicus]
MRKITGYISRTVFSAIALTLLVFISLDFIFSFIDQLGKIRGGYTSREAFIYMSLTVPRRLYELIPYSCLIGSLVGLGLLANSSELTVIRAAGVSVKRIAWMALRPAFVFIVAAVILGEYVAPYTEQMADNRRLLVRDNWVRTTTNMWNREGNEYMHVQAVLPSGVIYGLTRYQFDEQRRLVAASYTKQAIYQEEGYWQEEDVAVTRIGEQGVSNDLLPSRRWETPLKPNLLNILVMDPEDMSISNLNYYSNYLKEQNLRPGNYALAFWQKTLQPLATMSLVLIAISFIFGPLRSVTMGQRIFTGIVFGVGFQLLQKLMGPASMVFGFAPVFAVLIPIVICILVGVFLLSRAR